MQDYVEPTEAERRAVREYCIAHNDISVQSEPYTKRKRELTALKKTTRDAMFDYLIAHDLSCCVLPGEEKRYVRVKTYSNQASLNPELIADAVDELDEVPDSSQLRETILEAIKQKRLVTKQYADITTTLPKGTQGAIEEADEELTGLCLRYLETAEELSALEKELKEKLSPLKEAAASHESTVNAFMARANIASQRVNVNRDESTLQTYFIRRKTTRKRPRVTTQMLEGILERSITTIGDFSSNRHRFRDTVAESFDQLPTETSERISLDRGVLKKRERSD